MKSLLGNSCAKGCFIYLVALGVILAVTTFGLGGLKGRFTTTVIEAPPGLGTGGGSAPAGAGQVAAVEGVPGGGGILTPEPTQPPAPLPTLAVPPTPAPGGVAALPGVQFTPVTSPGGVISGGASAPFYIVQPGDTLWDIAIRFMVDIASLQGTNAMQGDTIFPGQVLYLPHEQPQQPQPALTPAAPLPTIDVYSTPLPQSTVIIPRMPNTGVVKAP